MEDLISIIVPVYNVEKYLDRCVTSIVNQTYRNLEIILVDDGSPDQCPQMCDAWAKMDPRIQVIHKVNQGLGMARNTGIEHATGKYLCFFDSDDYVDTKTIEKAYGAAIKTHSDIVVFGLQRVNDANEVIWCREPETPKERFCGNEVQELFLPDLIDNSHHEVVVKNLQLSACTSLFAADLIHKTGWRFVSERELISEDCYSLIWLYKYVHCVAVVPESLYYYQVNNNSLTRTFQYDRHKRNGLFYVQCVEMAQAQGLGDKVQKSIAALFMGFTMSAMKLLVQSDLSRREKKRMMREIINDEQVHWALMRSQERDYGKTKELLFGVMKLKWYFVCYLLLVLRSLCAML